MAYYYGQNTNSLIDQAAANVFKQGQTVSPAAAGGGTIRRKTCVNGQCPSGQKCVNNECVPATDGGGGGGGGGGTDRCANMSYPVKLPGSTDTCRQTWEPCDCPDEYESTMMGKRLCCKRYGGGGWTCTKDTDCAANQKCENGICKDVDVELVCAEGYNPPQAKDSSGKAIQMKPCKTGWVSKTSPRGEIFCCKEEGPGKCLKDADCPEGQTCVNGVCSGVVTPGCPDGVGTAYEGCTCGKKYMLKSGACAAGYVPVPKPEGTQCECSKWCVDIGWGEDCQTQTTKTGMGAYEYPAGLKELMDLLLGRGKEIMGMTPGFTPEALQGYFGRDFENLRAGEAATKRGLTSGLSRQGMLGTGTATRALGDLGWQTERGVSDILRDVSLANEAQKREDLSRYTGLGGDIAGQLTNFESILEAINAARRGEGTAAIQQLLSLLSLLKG